MNNKKRNKGKRIGALRIVSLVLALFFFAVLIVVIISIAKGEGVFGTHVPFIYAPVTALFLWLFFWRRPKKEKNNAPETGNPEIAHSTEPKDSQFMDIWDSFNRLAAHMQSLGKTDEMLFLVNMQQKAFDELRFHGHDINVRFNGYNGLISSFLPFMEGEEKAELICFLGRFATGYADVANGESMVYYADKLPNCIMVAIAALLNSDEVALSRLSSGSRDGYRLHIITDGDEAKYSEFKELAGKLSSVFDRLEVHTATEQGVVPFGALVQATKEARLSKPGNDFPYIYSMFPAPNEKQINLQDGHIEFLFAVQEASAIITARIYFKGRILIGSVKPKDILTLTDSGGKVLREGCPVIQTLIGEQECSELSKDDAGTVGIVVGVYLEPGDYSGLVFVKSKAVEAMQSPNVQEALRILTESRKRHEEHVNSVENSATLLSDGELMGVFTEYFLPNKEFYAQPGSPKYKAYFDSLNAATMEMQSHPQLYRQATKREPEELVRMCNNRIPGVTNSLICGLIFCVGKYAVVPSGMLCVDFAEAIPNCIAIYLLLTAQKLPAGERKKLIDAGDGVDKQPLIKAIDRLSVCDPVMEYKVM